MVLRSFTWMIGQFYKKGNEYFGVFNPVFLKFSFLFVVLLGNVVIFESIESAVERREKKKKNFYEILLRDISSLMDLSLFVRLQILEGIEGLYRFLLSVRWGPRSARLLFVLDVLSADFSYIEGEVYI
ncbi:uncharacterized protein LOC135161053 isoform X2 [Diachasmimorpha longicaudata]|uniref:uncharacterized protein LOC135161053 isoform X2 n=1 Tax=Diachasmimorpha longicaudata TaxID=58733 RepID=UPI0030B91C1C